MQDDFEFKPLTDGLGFHKKVIDLRDEQVAIETRTGILPKSKAFVLSPSLRVQTFDEQTENIKWIPATTSFAAGLFDFVMVIGVALLFSAAVFAITRIDFNQLVELLQAGIGTWVAVAILLFGVFEIYAVSLRTFFGRTLGEYAFGIRMGSTRDQDWPFYPLLVAWRGFVTVVTGVITLPLASLVLGRDVGGLLSGVDLFEEKN